MRTDRSDLTLPSQVRGRAPRRGASYLVGLVGLVGLGGLGVLAGTTAGCRRSSSHESPGETSASTTATQNADAPAAAAGTEADAAPSTSGESAQGPVAAELPSCRDWSSLDPSSLPALPGGPFTAEFERVWETVRTKHFDPTINCVDWPAARARHGAGLASVTTKEQAVTTYRALLGELHQSHLAVWSPVDPVFDAPEGNGRPDLDVRWIEDELVVTRSGAATVPVGSRFMGARDRDPAQIVAHARASGGSDDVSGSSFALQVQRAAASLLACSPGAPKSLRVQPPGASAAKTVSAPCIEREGEQVSFGHLTGVHTVVQGRLVNTPEGRPVGVLHFNIWMLPMVQRVQAELSRLREAGAEAIVLDLRGNPGGVGAMAIPVARLFLPQGGDLGTLSMRGFDQRFPVPAEPTAFAGPLLALVDEGTASTSEIFLAGLRELGRVTVVGGRNSAGAALPSMIEQLDSGALFQFIVGSYHTPNGAVAEGEGIAPDVRVEETRAAFEQGRDPVLEAALGEVDARQAKRAQP